MLIYVSASTADNAALRYGLRPCPFGTLLPSVATSHMLGMSGCVKTHVCMTNKPYISFKSENKGKNSLNFVFSHSLMLCAIAKICKLLIYLTYLKVRMRKMSEKVQLKGCIYGISSDMQGYRQFRPKSFGNF